MARPKKVNENAEYLNYALLHLEREREALDAKIAHVRKQLGLGGTAAAAAPAPVKKVKAASKPVVAEAAPPAAEGKTRKARVLSPAARKRISLAQKKRWAANRGEKAE